MTINEASNIKKGDKVIYLCDDWNNNDIEVLTEVTNIWKNNGVVTHFDVKNIDKQKKVMLNSAFAPISCFKIIQ